MYAFIYMTMITHVPMHMIITSFCLSVCYFTLRNRIIKALIFTAQEQSTRDMNDILYIYINGIFPQLREWQLTLSGRSGEV